MIWQRNSFELYPKNLGFGLIEALIAAFILSFCLLSIAAFENASLTQTYNNYLNSLTTVRLIAIAERFHAGVGESEFSAWNQENVRLLPHAAGTYSGCSSKGYTIKLCWHRQKKKKHCQKVVISAQFAKANEAGFNFFSKIHEYAQG